MAAKEWNHNHMISEYPDTEVYRRQCRALERHIPGLAKGKLLQDVDGSDYQYYTLNGAEIVVENDCYLEGVYIRSDVDLLPYFLRTQAIQAA